MRKVLVLGFYDRANAGDETYKLAFKRVFGDQKVKLEFRCTDDVKEVSSDVDCIICGGGDIVNSYFMARVEKLVAGFVGRVYALSVGIPYESEARYLHIFDHVFVRSVGDMEIAVREIGALNVSLMPDAAFALQPSPTSFKISWGGKNKSATTSTSVFKLGVCLAQPAFHANAKGEELLRNVCEVLKKLSEKYVGLEVHLFNFNTSVNIAESDVVLNDRFTEILDPSVKVFTVNKDALIETIGQMSVVLCMRYHSVVFSLIKLRQIVCLYCSPKVGRLIDDFKQNIAGAIKMDIDSIGKPLRFDAKRLFEMIDDAYINPKSYALKTFDWSSVGKIIFEQKKLVRVLVKNNFESFDNILFICKKVLMKYLGIGSAEYESLLRRRGAFQNGNLALARLVCYAVTKSVQSAYVWGLSDNMKRSDFCLYEAVKYIWEDSLKLRRGDGGEVYYPKLVKARRDKFVALDYVFQNDFNGYHRSGWAYVIGGLMNFDAHQLMRTCGNELMVDTYVDRSFHWGMETLLTVGVLPYVKPWIGFVHHTFDTLHSSYNCVELFKNPVFLESAKTCRGLIALTEYLARDLRANLIRCGLSKVRVFVLYHPMEVVDLGFSFSKFLANPNRKVIQIGAWLRDPYAIYALGLWKNKLGLTKCALKGRDMDHYFVGKDFLDGIRQYLYNVQGNRGAGEICRPHCISGNTVNYLCNSVNKYCTGLYDVISRNHKSVMMLERVDNSGYDLLLSENIVFLKLVDCSAVNTVLECLMRCTVLVVNRHPAIEEVLGVGYPGFYDDMVGASMILNDIDTLKACYVYLKKLPKDQFTLDYFLKGFQNICEMLM